MERKDIYLVEYKAEYDNPTFPVFSFFEYLVGNHDIASRIGSNVSGKIIPDSIVSTRVLSDVLYDEKHISEYNYFDVYRVVQLDRSSMFDEPKEVKTLFYIIASYPAEVYQIIRENSELTSLTTFKDPLFFYGVKLDKFNVTF